MNQLALGNVFEQLKAAFGRRQFEILIPVQSRNFKFFARSKKHKSIPISINVELGIDEGIRIRICNDYSLRLEKVETALHGHEEFFSVNSDGDIEKNIPADMGAYPDIDQIADKFTRAYCLIVSN